MTIGLRKHKIFLRLILYLFIIEIQYNAWKLAAAAIGVYYITMDENVKNDLYINGVFSVAPLTIHGVWET